MSGRALKVAHASLLVLAAAILTVPTRPGIASGRSKALALVRGISIHSSSAGAVIIDIATTKPVPYRTLQLKNPERLVVDLKGASKATLRSVYSVQSSILKRVRVGQWRSHPAIVRVVADLKGTPAFSIHADPSGIWIKLKPRTQVTSPARRSQSRYRRVAGDTSARSVQSSSHRRDPKYLFTVHQFADLTASLTAPDLPPRDHLIPVTKPQPEAESSKDGSSLALVSGITIKPASNGGTDVDIASTRSIPYRIFQVPDPFRLVIDLKNARDGARKRLYPADSPVLKSVRVAQWRSGDPSIVRVVVDLAGYPIFDVYARQPGIHIYLRPRLQFDPLIRNPFQFAIRHRNVHLKHPAGQLNQAMTAATDSPAIQPGDSFSDLKVIGYIDEHNSGMQAIISDRSNIYFVPQGGTIEKTFRVLSISANAVQVQNLDTLQTRWLAYTP